EVCIDDDDAPFRITDGDAVHRLDVGRVLLVVPDGEQHLRTFERIRELARKTSQPVAPAPAPWAGMDVAAEAAIGMDVPYHGPGHGDRVVLLGQGAEAAHMLLREVDTPDECQLAVDD